MAFWGLAGPATQSLMTRRVSSSEQGQLQGAIASINGVTGLIGPTLFTQTFAYFILSDARLQPVPRTARRTIHPRLAHAHRRRCDCVADDESGGIDWLALMGVSTRHGL